MRRDGHLLEVTINRPEARNSLHPMANDELDHVFDAFFADGDLWVAILTGAGDKAFSAGQRPRVLRLGQAHVGAEERVRRPDQPALDLPKPVIAAVNGYAMGGGCEIALACHLVVADATAQFALSEVKVGLIAGAGGLVRLPRTVPPKVATEMILTGRRVGADRGPRLRPGQPGDACGPGAGRGPRARRRDPGRLADLGPALAAGMTETRGIPDVIDAVTQHCRRGRRAPGQREDAAEGMVAFAQKRRPVWRNR